MTEERLWVVAYDSPNNKRRRKLATLLEGYGERMQWSVFECRLHPDQLRRMRQGLARIATACRNGPRPLSNWAGRWSPRFGKTR